MTIKAIFFDEHGRPRSGWRFSIFATAFLFTVVLLITIVSLVFTYVGGVPGSVAYLALFHASVLTSALFIGWLCNRFLDNLPFSSLGATFGGNAIKHFAIGLAIGAATLALTVGIINMFGGLSFTLNNAGWRSIISSMGSSLLIFAIGAASEEALSRGYPMQTFLHSNLTAFGIVLMSALFTALHWDNPNSNTISLLNTFLAGVWFAVGYLKTRDLWMPFGMHLMWNWMQGSFFGIEVSGLTDITSASIFNEIDRGPSWLTGSTYGIEAGVACTAAIAISMIAMAILPLRVTK